MQWEIFHIPGKNPNSLDDSLVDVLASTVEPKLANSLVRQVNQICPLETLRHVKRVRRRTTTEGKIELSVILCVSHGHDDPMEGISDDLRQIINVYNLRLFRAKVAKYAALSKEEWEEQCKLWPTSYHPPTNLDGTAGFSEEDSQLSFDYMRTTIRLAKLSSLAGKVVNAAVIVDPLSKRIIATANDETCSPTSNNTGPEDISCNNKFKTTSSPLSIAYGSGNEEDSVAKPSPNTCGQSYTEVSCLYPWGWTAQKPHNESSLVKCGNKSNISWHPLRHAALVAIEKAAARDRQLFPGPGSAEDQSNFDDSLQHLSNGFQAKRQKTKISEDDDISGKDDHTNGFPCEEMRPYLCTGFDIYLVWEPCTMCAMALVHQRIRRIFYAFPNPNAGALGSVYRLQGEKSLNHHYSVFRILLPEEALYEVD